MIKVPATPAGLDALEELCAAGVTLNVTLIFTMRQYEAARDAMWRGAQQRKSLDAFKSVYSIFVSRVDVYTEKHVPELSPAAQGQVGIVNAKRIWQANQKFWAEAAHAARSRRSSSPAPAPRSPRTRLGNTSRHWPAATSKRIPPPPTKPSQKSGRTFHRAPSTRCRPQAVLDEIDAKVDVAASAEAADERGRLEIRRPTEERCWS